ncbi:protein containing Signal transduction response regulator, receiver region [Candidatus Magnetomorum sp. HK-1]|nr:protein containing Signal transduction response regulator, receiver region [Candidatus Magnetomorum sp. HK-1]
MNTKAKIADNILIVDDIRENLRLLGDILTQKGYNVRPAPNGTRALSAVRTNPPDLILLDILMPDISGYEVCEQLKNDEKTRDIPIIFVSAVNEIVDKVKAFSLGGVDYITKPFQVEEVLARVETHLELVKLQKTLQHNNEQLLEEIHLRKEAENILRQKNEDLTATLDKLKKTQNQLIESEKMAALGGLVAGIAHEINTPIDVGVTAASTLVHKTESIMDLYKSGKLKGSDIKTYMDHSQKSCRLILSNLERNQELVQSFKQVAVDQTHLKLNSFIIKNYIEKILISLSPKLKQKKHQIIINGDDQLSISSYPGTFSQIITNLILNSISHAYPDNVSGNLRFDFYMEKDKLILEYSDDGCGIPQHHMKKIFEPFFTTARSSGGTGLGLHIIYNLITQTLKGKIHCKSEEGKGTKFIIQLPSHI